MARQFLPKLSRLVSISIVVGVLLCTPAIGLAQADGGTSSPTPVVEEPAIVGQGVEPGSEATDSADEGVLADDVVGAIASRIPIPSPTPGVVQR